MNTEDILRAHVRAALRNAGISQAEACRQLGVTTKHMSEMLTGKATLTLPWAERILALCGVRLVLNVQQLTPEPTIAALVTGSVDEWCGSEPPFGEFTAADGTVGVFGDCDCTKPPGHDGDHACEPCTARHGAPSWASPNRSAAPTT